MSDRNEPTTLSAASTRRSFLQMTGLTAGIVGISMPTAIAEDETSNTTMTYELPPLPCEYDALAPTIDAKIMRLHHDKHHRGYVDGANAALESLAEMRQSGNFDEVKAVKRDLSFNLSGHVNHSVFWKSMSPDGGGKPYGKFADAIDEHFGSFEGFKQDFSAAAKNVEGSGWGMLVFDHISDEPMVIQAENHNDIAVQGSTPLLVLDVWEHAYYLQYENARGDYVDNFWNVVDWDSVAKRYETAQNANVFGDC
ncbi:superoxide dismutase [Haladaptatus sp. DFWS20]|uniref:superoxide dismutase n=1 Tax=Haladaptatus sp. DFWS20 TaxID=3403467 RepID=UPI003EB8B7D9